MTTSPQPLGALVASATPRTAQAEALGALAATASPTTAPVEPLGSHVAPPKPLCAPVATATPMTASPKASATPMTALAEALGALVGALVATASPTTALDGPPGGPEALGNAHDAKCFEKREWSLARCDDAYVRTCEVLSAP